MTRPAGTLSARLVSIRSWWLKLGSALTGDVPHPFAAEYPWPGCWCSKPEDDKAHGSARPPLRRRVR